MFFDRCSAQNSVWIMQISSDALMMRLNLTLRAMNKDQENQSAPLALVSSIFLPSCAIHASKIFVFT